MVSPHRVHSAYHGFNSSIVKYRQTTHECLNHMAIVLLNSFEDLNPLQTHTDKVQSVSHPPYFTDIIFGNSSPIDLIINNNHGGSFYSYYCRPSSIPNNVDHNKQCVVYTVYRILGALCFQDTFLENTKWLMKPNLPYRYSGRASFTGSSSLNYLLKFLLAHYHK
jgi:hypothetical protein